ncbi:uncharacterized protein LOC111689189 [Lucilia cuprina]|uniref:uncharacterized protein LOC111689189 n=1 Tax=Lucilia cuprina TaxID=7375 RepID=UPI001F057944|nr:uncharacterized protein LOC111689189 [Lucilia cuprina]
MLSRLPQQNNVDEIQTDDLLDFETTEFESDEYLELVKQITENGERLPDLKIVDGKIFKRMINETGLEDHQWKLWIPPNLTQAIIEKAHSTSLSAHGRMAKTIEKVKRFFYWPKMVLQIKEFVKNCIICKETKPANIHLMPGIGNEVTTERPFQKLPCEKRQQQI